MAVRLRFSGRRHPGAISLVVIVAALLTVLGPHLVFGDAPPTPPTPAELKDDLSVSRKCEACHAYVDTFYLTLQKVFEEQKKTKAHNKIAEINSDQMLWRICDEMRKGILWGDGVVRLCQEFVAVNAKRLMETFSSRFEVSDTTDNFYMKKRKLCNDVVPGCGDRFAKPNKEITTCEACKFLVDDIQRVTSWGVGRKNFGTSGHLYRVLDDICLSLTIRYPQKYRMRVLETCTDLMEDHSKSIVNAITESIKKKDAPSVQRRICYEKAQMCIDGKQEL